ncbi:hypothetical protein [Cystobacter ferrugineus]|uniref:PDZ domain-containing protein n=1 Tax=Cystobacter ferrugineus TaxID=83449 RepID=A0A1L9B3T3_9BACT|nr:hypothetical protein [Cystobacter ferrugineus]OJH36929.1 hypothetical protein BON30_31045 [Cystobacter ferrugineus]
MAPDIVLVRVWILTLLLATPVALASTPPSAPPALDVVLAPHTKGGAVDRLEVRMRIGHPDLAAGQTLLRMPLTWASIPTARYDAAAIQASDAKGPLELVAVDETSIEDEVYRHWKLGRGTVGDVRVRYGTPPRVVSSETRNGPLFDLRGEAGGIMGAGVYFFALPHTEQSYRITLEWDLSGMPAGSRGIWSLGEGSQSTVAPADTLAHSFYAAGPVKSAPAEGEGNFSLYWLSPPPFDAGALSNQIRELYGHMSEFFQDAGAPYRVFVRANPYPSGGGTAFPRSFMFGYGPGGETIGRGTLMLIAHEMAHNWPTLHGEGHGDYAWYTEGTADYYAALLALRSGVIDQARFLSIINGYASDYYTNPFRSLGNEQVAARFWSDARAQRVPYGRGFMYLARVDAQMREKSGGKRSLDTLVLEILARQRQGEKVGVREWIALVTRELGASARAEFEDMVAGKTIVPLPNSFGPCWRPVAVTERPFDLGFDEMRLAVVRDLRPGSAAEQAGVKEGDKILSMTPLQQARSHSKQKMELTVERGGRRLRLSYSPRGAPVPGWRWTRKPGVSDVACKL